MQRNGQWFEVKPGWERATKCPLYVVDHAIRDKSNKILRFNVYDSKYKPGTSYSFSELSD